MELFETMRTTSAVREFSDADMTDEVLYRILDNARFAPSGGNRQGGHVVVVRDPATRRRLAELTEPAARRYVAQADAGESPWNSLRPPGPTPGEIAATEIPARMITPLLAAAVVLVVFVDLAVVASVDQDLERVGVVSGASIYPLVWNILLAARHEGFGGTITTGAAAEEAGVKELLGASGSLALAAILPLGHPIHQPTRLRRRSVEEFVTLERVDGAPLSR